MSKILAAAILLTGYFVLLIGSTPASANPLYTLTISPANNNAGENLSLARITSSPAGIDCGLSSSNVCSAQFASGTSVTLTATPQNGNIAVTWDLVTFFHAMPQGPYLPCTGINLGNGQVSGNVCSNGTMPASDVTVRVSAAYPQSTLHVSKTGTGTGTVANQNPIKPPLLINCGSVCSSTISSSLILFALPDPGSVFAGWNINGASSSDCGPTNYAPKCLSGIQVNVDGTGGTDSYVAVFNKVPAGSTGNTTTTTPPAPSVTAKVGSKVLTGNPTILSNQTLILSGTTSPGDVVTIVLHSTPKTYTTTANQSGNWQVLIANIPVGSHTIDAQVTDPVTKLKSDTKQVLAFSVVSPNTNTASTSATSSTDVLRWVILGILAICLVALIALLLLKRRRGKSKTIMPLETNGRKTPDGPNPSK